MKSKEDVIKPFWHMVGPLGGVVSDAQVPTEYYQKASVFAAMDEYAKEVAIDFAVSLIGKTVDKEGENILTYFDQYLKSKNNESKA